VSLGIPFNPLSSMLGSLLTSPSSSALATASSASQSTLASGVSSTTPFANLNLTSSESAEISAILKTSQGQPFGQIASSISNVLTPSQQKTFAGDLQAMQMRGGHHHHGGGGGGSGSSSTIDSGTDAFGVASISSSSNPSTAPTSTSSLFSELAAMFSAQSQTQQQNQLLEL
jgi:hypothetical protein